MDVWHSRLLAERTRPYRLLRQSSINTFGPGVLLSSETLDQTHRFGPKAAAISVSARHIFTLASSGNCCRSNVAHLEMENKDLNK